MHNSPLHQAVRRRYNPDNNPWDPPLRNYGRGKWPTYPTVQAPRQRKHRGILSKIGKAVNDYSFTGGWNPSPPVRQSDYVDKRRRG